METRRKLSRLTGEDMNEGLARLLEGDLIYRCSFSQIAKHFLAPYLPIQMFSSDFVTIRENYILETQEGRDLTKKVTMEELGAEIAEDNIPEGFKGIMKQLTARRWLY